MTCPQYNHTKIHLFGSLIIDLHVVLTLTCDAPQVEAFARRQLDLLLAAPQASSPAADSRASPCSAPAASAAPAAAAEAAPAEAGPGTAAKDAQAGGGADVKAESDRAPPVAAMPTAAAAHVDGATSGGPAAGEPDAGAVAEAARRCGLFCALCTKRHSLLRRLLEVCHSAAACLGPDCHCCANGLLVEKYINMCCGRAVVSRVSWRPLRGCPGEGRLPDCSCKEVPSRATPCHRGPKSLPGHISKQKNSTFELLC